MLSASNQRTKKIGGRQVYRRPGVYFEQVDSRLEMIGLRRTDIAGMVGFTARGPLHRPVKLESWTQFRSVFGGHIPQGYLAYAVEGFFANGGRTCWVVRAADPKSVRPASLGLGKNSDQQIIPIVASSVGSWGKKVRITVIPHGGDRYTLYIAGPEGEQEVWRDVSLRPKDPHDPRYIRTILNDPQTGSNLVKAFTPLDFGSRSLQAREQLFPEMELLKVDGQVVSGRLAGGTDGLSTVKPEHFAGYSLLPVLSTPESLRTLSDPCDETVFADQPLGLTALEAIDEVSIVAIPDIMPKLRYEASNKVTTIPCEVLDSEPDLPPVEEIPIEFPPQFTKGQIFELQSELIGHCEKLKDRVAVLDAFPKKANPTEVIEWRKGFNTKFAALYYPWLKVPDPLQLEGLLRLVPPSGHVAGVYARVDQLVGVHKPPANEVVEGAMDVATPVDDLSYEELNQQGVDLIRPFPGRGLRVAGARTMSSDTEWRFVNVRRLLSMIEESIAESTQWTVFESNNAGLWNDVDRMVRSFLEGLWRRGMLDGATADEAFYVRCDETTNPPEEEDKGRMICLIGVQPPWPAEFVIVRIGRTVSGTEILEMSGNQNGEHG